MASWQNWSGKLTAEPARIHHLRSEADACALARHGAATGQTIRAVGAGHSHAPLVPTDGIVVDTSALSGVRSVDPEARRAWIWAGTPIYALGRPLQDAGLALSNQGDIDRQTIGGAVATGTHGTGITLTNLSATVTAARIATADGELVECSSAEAADAWQVGRLNLGAAGIVTQLEIQLRDAYRLRQRGWTEHIDETIPRLHDLASSARHFEFFWFPTTGEVVAKATDETDEPPEYPTGPEGRRCGWNHEVLPNHRDWPHTEMEYSVPLEQGPACLDAIRELLAREFPDMGYPVEYRTVAGDDVWLSPAYQRPTVTISMHVDVREDDEPLFRACEEVFMAHDGRPHWGKVHYLGGADLASVHERWDEWWRVRDLLDPGGVFLNQHLRALRIRTDGGAR